MTESNENATDRASVGRTRIMNIRLVQNFSLVWLDENIHLDNNNND